MILLSVFPELCPFYYSRLIEDIARETLYQVQKQQQHWQKNIKKKR